MTGADATPATADDDSERTDRDDAHLQNVDPGAGCTEIWEHLAGERDGGDEAGTDGGADQ